MAEKLTPEEIKKALECCKPENESCLNCPLIDVSVPECAGILYKATIALINRQKSAIDVYMQENDRLKTAYIQVSMDRDKMLEDLQFRTNQVIEQQAEIERLEVLFNEWKKQAYKAVDEKEELYSKALEWVRSAKAIAIKEVLDRFDIEYCKVFSTPKISFMKEFKRVFLKEMVGDDK